MDRRRRARSSQVAASPGTRLFVIGYWLRDRSFHTLVCPRRPGSGYRARPGRGMAHIRQCACGTWGALRCRFGRITPVSRLQLRFHRVGDRPLFRQPAAASAARAGSRYAPTVRTWFAQSAQPAASGKGPRGRSRWISGGSLAHPLRDSRALRIASGRQTAVAYGNRSAARHRVRQNGGAMLASEHSSWRLSRGDRRSETRATDAIFWVPNSLPNRKRCEPASVSSHCFAS